MIFRSRRIAGGALIAALTWVASLGAAHAQSASAAAADTLEEVTVTGTRLQATGFSTPTPVTVVGEEMFEQRAPTDMSEVFRDLPSNRFSSGATSTGAGQANTAGQAFVDLRGLTIARTLVLIDGRRTTATGGQGAFDINMIPTGLVERVEVVTGGASAAYGSDAVAGVANFILKDKLEGFSGTLQGGVTDHGDNRQIAGGLAFGTALWGGRGHFLVGADASDVDGVGPWYARGYGRKEPGLISLGNAGPTGAATPATRVGKPAQAYVNGFELANNTPGGIVTAGPLRGTAFRADGTPYAFQYGTVVGSNMYDTTSNYGDGPNSFLNVSTAYKRRTGLARLSYDFTDDTKAVFEVAGGHNYASNIQNVSNTSTTVTLNNPYIPAATRAAMLAAGQTSITVGRTNTDLGPFVGAQTDDNLRLLASLTGKLAGSWSWDASYSHSNSRLDGTFTGYRTADINAAFGAVTVNGVAQCATVAGASAGCVPFNIFGSGNASAAAYDYLRQYTQEFLLTLKQDVVEASIRGEPVNLWAGPLAVAVGGDYRKDVQNNDREADSARFPQGGFASANFAQYASSRNVKEGFAEVNLPLLREVAAVKSLDLNGAARYTSYSDTGNYNTWKVGLTYDINEQYRLRATHSRDIRAPTLFEQYGTGPVSTMNIQNTTTGTTDTANFQKGPNPDLRAESGDTVTFGLVVQPSWASGLRLSVDYFKIKIAGALTVLGGQQLFDGCRLGIAAYCRQLTFDGTGRVTAISQQLLNLNELKTDGVDLEASYKLPRDVFGGNLSLRLLATYGNSYTTRDVSNTITDSGRTSTLPQWRGTLNLTYAKGAFSTTATVTGFTHVKASTTVFGPDDSRYYATVTSAACPGGTTAVPAQCANYLVAGNSVNVNLFPAAAYLNLSAQYDLPVKALRRLQIFAVINNVANKQPPDFAFIAIANALYDPLGRSYKAGVRLNF